MKTKPTNNERPSHEARSRRMKTALSWAVVAALAAFIFFMSAQSGDDLDQNSGIVSVVKAWLAAAALALFGHGVDVSPVGHFAEYLLLGAALANALRFTPWTAFDDAHATGAIGGFPLPFLALCIASLYGVTDEFHQIFTPMRSCDPADWLVDTAAATLGALAMWILMKPKTKATTDRFDEVNAAENPSAIILNHSEVDVR